jgi:hypothetical protein
MPTAAPATPVKPSNPAISAMIKNMSVHPNIKPPAFFCYNQLNIIKRKMCQWNFIAKGQLLRHSLNAECNGYGNALANILQENR